MSLLTVESFGEHTQTEGTARLAERGWVAGGTPIYVADPASITGTGAIGLVSNETITSPAFSVVDEIIIGAWLRFTGTADLTPDAISDILIRFRSNTLGTQVSITASSQASGEVQLDVRRGDHTGTIISTTTTGLIDTNTWDFYEFRVKLHNTLGEVEIKRGESVIHSDTGLDTQDKATPDMNVFGFGCLGGTVEVSSIYCVDMSGATNNDFLGEVYIVGLEATSDTAQADWAATGSGTPFQNIDEYYLSSGVGSINSSTVGDKSVFGMKDLPAAQSTKIIHGVRVEKYGGATSGTQNFRANLHSGATVSNGATELGDTSFSVTSDFYDINPDTSSEWSASEVDAIELEAELLT